MADVGLGGDEGHGNAVADLALAEIGVEDHRELVGRTEAGRARRRPHDHRAGVPAEFLPRARSGLRMFDVADRLGVPAMRSESRHLVEGEVGASGDYQVVVADGTAVIELDLVAFGMQPLGSGRYEVDSLLRHDGCDRNLD